MPSGTELVWDEVGERLYETGIRKCALYPYDTTSKEYKPGVAWSGITSVTESPSGAEATDMYADDIKYLSMLSAEKLDGTIEAYMYPDEFAECDGSVEAADGVMVSMQPRKTFGLCYRTILGNDTENENYGYKLHLMYGCKVTPSQRQYQTINDSPSANTFSWGVNTTPVSVSGRKATSLITIDSTKANATRLKTLEDILYGVNEEARLPLPDEVISIMEGTTPTETVTLTFNANGHGTAPEAETVTKGTAATAPTDPEAEGYTFGGWYEEAACTNVFSFATVLNADKTVYAKWTESEG